MPETLKEQAVRTLDSIRRADRIVTDLTRRQRPLQATQPLDTEHDEPFLMGMAIREAENLCHRAMEEGEAAEGGHEDPLVQASVGAAMIAAERLRQIKGEEFIADYDDRENPTGELADGAACYAIVAAAQARGAKPEEFTLEYLDESENLLWNLRAGDWKPSADRLRNLARAGALIAAEIDRVMREQAARTLDAGRDGSEDDGA